MEPGPLFSFMVYAHPGCRTVSTDEAKNCFARPRNVFQASHSGVGLLTTQ